MISLNLSAPVIAALNAEAKRDRRSRSSVADLALERTFLNGSTTGHRDSGAHQTPPAGDLATKLKPDPR